MKRFTWYLTMILALSIAIPMVDAKGSKSSTRSSTKSSFKSTPKATPSPKPKPTPKVERSTEKSKFKTKETAKAATTTQKTGIDNKLSKKSATGKQTYKTKAEAKEAYCKSLPQNNYKTQPSVRPNHIPEYTTYNGVRTQTVFVGGTYGTYRNGRFYSYNDDDYFFDDASMLAAGIIVGSAMNQPHTQVVRTQPATVVQKEATNGADVMIVFLWIIGIIGGIVVVIFVIKKWRKLNQ